MTLKDMIRLVTPPLFIQLAKRLRGIRPTDAYGLSADFRSWDEAMAASTGYDNEIMRNNASVTEDRKSTIPLIEMFKANNIIRQPFDLLRSIAEAINI